MNFPRVRTRVTSITTTSSLLLAGMISLYLYRRFHSSQSYAREEICTCPAIHKVDCPAAGSMAA